MNVLKFLRKYMLVILLILVVSSTIAYMNYQSMVEKKEGFMSDSTMNILGGIAVFVVFILIVGISMFLMANGGVPL